MIIFKNLLWPISLVVLFSTVKCESSRREQKSHRRTFYQPQHYLNQGVQQFLREEGTKVLCLIFGLCTTFPNEITSEKPDLKTVYEWVQLEFAYESPFDRNQAIESGELIPGVPAPIDADVWYPPGGSKIDKKIFVSIPRFQEGNPVALGYVSKKSFQGNPLIVPYPSWEWHKNPTRCNKNRIVSVYRTMIDECDRLWVLDNGHYGTPLSCRPQLLAFDLKTDQLVYRYEFPEDQYNERSIFVTPVVDVRDPRGQCQDTFVYAADCQLMQLLVLDVKRQTSWVISNKLMYPFPTFGTYTILGESFELMDGILGLTLSPNVPGDDRRLFFHAMSSNTENYVRTSDIRNQQRFLNNSQAAPEIFQTYKGTRHSQAAAEASDRNGIVFFGDVNSVTLNCWNSMTEYGPENIHVVGNNKKILQFPSGVKVIDNPSGYQELWVVTSRFQKVMAGTLSTTEPNFRILAIKTEDLLHGSRCKSEHFNSHHHHHHIDYEPKPNFNPRPTTEKYGGYVPFGGYRVQE